MRTIVLVSSLALVLLVAFLLAGGGEQSPFPRDPTSIDPGAVYDPVSAGETLPAGFRQLLARDSILPVYEPEFVEASASPWDDEALVIGVELGGEARAYPVSFLNRREMVIDRFGDIPILVTW